MPKASTAGAGWSGLSGLSNAELALHASLASCWVGSVWQQACLLTMGRWHLLLFVPAGELPTMSCNHSPYDTKHSDMLCCRAGGTDGWAAGLRN